MFTQNFPAFHSLFEVFKEPRLIFENAPEKASPTQKVEAQISAHELQKRSLEKREKAKAERLRERQEEGAETAKELSTVNLFEEALTQMKLPDKNADQRKNIFDNLLKGEIEFGGEKKTGVNLSLAMPENITDLFKFADTQENRDHFYTGLLDKVENNTLNAYHLNKESIAIILKYLVGEDAQNKIKKLAEAITVSPTRTSEFIEVTQELYGNDKEKQKKLLTNLGETGKLKEFIKEWGEKFSKTSIATLINLEVIKMPEDKAIIESLPLRTKIALFIDETGELSSENGRQTKEHIWNKILEKDLDELAQKGESGLLKELMEHLKTAEDKRRLAFQNKLKDFLGNSPKSINKLSPELIIAIFKSLLEHSTAEANDEMNSVVDMNNQRLLEELAANLNRENREKLAKDTSLPNEIRSKIYLGKSIETKKEAASDEARLQTIEGFKIEGNKIKFRMPPEENGSERSFSLSRALKLMQTIRKDAEKSGEKVDINLLLEKVKLAVYQELLNIVTKDGSINSNKWNVTDFRASNRSLAWEIAQLEDKIESGNAEFGEHNLVLLENKVNSNLAKRVLDVKKYGTFEVAADGTVKLSKETKFDNLSAVYNEMTKVWRKPPASKKEGADPFTKEAFINANEHLKRTNTLALGTILILPFAQNSRIPLEIMNPYETEEPTPGTEEDKNSADSTVDRAVEESETAKRQKVAEHYNEIKTKILAITQNEPFFKRPAEEVVFSDEMREAEDGTYTYSVLIGKIPQQAKRLNIKFYKDSPIDDMKFSMYFSNEPPREPKSWLSEPNSLDVTLRSFLANVENNNPIDPSTKSETIKEMAESGGIIFEKEPEKLTTTQLTTLQDCAILFWDNLKLGKSGEQIIKLLRGEISRKLASKFTEPDTKISFKPYQNLDQKFTWTREKGFGSPNEIATILKAIKESELSPEEYQKYSALTDTAAGLRERNIRERVESADRLGKAKTLWNKRYELDKKIGEMKEEDMRLYWEQLIGHNLVEAAMTRSPFNYDRQRIRAIATKIITEGRNDRVYLKDILPHINVDVKALLPEADTILEKYSRELKLRKKDIGEIARDPEKCEKLFFGLENLCKNLGKSGDIEAATEVRNFYLKFHARILNPCFEVLDAITQMKSPEKGLDKREIHSSLDAYRNTTGNSKIVDSLYGIDRKKEGFFNYTEKKTPTNWQKMFAYFRRETQMSMAVMDGKAMDIYEGTFRSFYDPQAALAIMLNSLDEKEGNPKFYTLDENGEKILNEKALAQAVIDLIIKGLQLSISEEILAKTKTNLNEKTLKATNSAIAQLNSLKPTCETIRQILELADKNPKLKLAFQLGFMADQKERAEAQKALGIETIIENSPPQVKAILKELQKSGKLSEQELVETKHTLVGAGFLAFNQGGGLQGAGVGTSIKINDTLTISFGIGYNGASPIGVDVGVAFTISIFRNQRHEVDLNMGASIAGGAIRIGYTGKDQIAKGVDYRVGAGVAGTYIPPYILPFVDIGIDWTRRVDVLKQERLEAARNKSMIKKVWEKWPDMSYGDKVRNIDAMLTEIGGVKENLAFLDERYPGILSAMPPAEKTRLYINMVDHYIRQNKQYINEKTKPFYIGAIGFGFAYMQSAAQRSAGGAACMGLKIYIPGSGFEAFVPHPKERERLRNIISQETLDTQINKWLGEENNLAFREMTSETYYKPGSNLGIGVLTSESEATFEESGNMRTDIAKFNEDIKPAEIKLKYHPDSKRTEITIQNTKDRNVEIHIDPLLKDLGLIMESGKLYLKGNIDTLIITREKFTFPFPLDRTDKAFGVDARQTNLLDIITIRTKESMFGNRNRDTIENLEPAYLEKLQGQDTYTVHPGLSQGAKGNLINLEKASLEQKQAETELSAKTPERMKNQMDKARLAELDSSANRRQRSLQGTEAMEDFTGLTPQMRKFVDNEFYKFIKKDLALLTDTTDDLALSNLVTEKWPEAVKKYNENPKNKEKLPETLTTGQHNEVMNLLPREWWSTIYPHKTDNKEIPQNLHEPRQEALSANIPEFITLESGCFITKEFKVKEKELDVTVKLTNKRDVIIVDNKQNIAFYARDYNLKGENSWETIPAGKEPETIAQAKYKEVLRKCSAEIKKQDAENTEINEKIAKNIERSINSTSRRLKEKFPEAAANLKTTHGIDIADTNELVEKFIKDVYGDLRDTLKKQPPVDFRSLAFSYIDRGSTLMSGSREGFGDKRTPSVTRIIGYQTMGKKESLVHEYGMLAITEKNYEDALKYTTEELTSDPEKKKERDIALLMLEIASPSALSRKIETADQIIDSSKDSNEKKAQEWIDYFRSPFVMKIYSMRALQLLTAEGNYDKTTEIVKAINGGKSADEIVQVIEQNKEALFEFTKYVNELRKAQTHQAPYKDGVYRAKSKRFGYKVEINMADTLRIQGGAFTKCANPSFAVKENFEVKVYNPIKVRGLAKETNMVADSELTRVFAYVDLLGAVTYGGERKKESSRDGKHAEDGPKDKGDTPPSEDGKHANDGQKEGGTSGGNSDTDSQYTGGGENP